MRLCVSLALHLLLAAFLLVSCDEGEHDYVYCVTNHTDHNVNLSYKIFDDSRSFSKSILPGQTDTLCWRRDVSGNDVWDVESGSEIFMISSLQADINSSSFSDNLRLRNLWSGVSERDGNGCYVLDITDDMFVYKSYKYYYGVTNNSSYYLSYMLTVPTGKSLVGQGVGEFYLFGPYSCKLKQIEDIDKDKDKLSQITMSVIEAIDLRDTLYSCVNPNKRDAWAFKTVLFQDQTLSAFDINAFPGGMGWGKHDVYLANDSVAVYDICITNDMLK